jgi:carbon storage regulator
MLVLTRRVGESIVIAEDIRIAVVSIRGDRVRIGVAAPADVRVDRLEIHERRAAAAEEAEYHQVPAAVPAK